MSRSLVIACVVLGQSLAQAQAPTLAADEDAYRLVFSGATGSSGVLLSGIKLEDLMGRTVTPRRITPSDFNIPSLGVPLEIIVQRGSATSGNVDPIRYDLTTPSGTRGRDATEWTLEKWNPTCATWHAVKDHTTPPIVPNTETIVNTAKFASAAHPASYAVAIDMRASSAAAAWYPIGRTDFSSVPCSPPSPPPPPPPPPLPPPLFPPPPSPPRPPPYTCTDCSQFWNLIITEVAGTACSLVMGDPRRPTTCREAALSHDVCGPWDGTALQPQSVSHD